MSTVQERPVETRDEAITRILRAGRVAMTEDELYGPGPEPDDPDDLEEFLALRDAMRRPVQVPDEER